MAFAPEMTEPLLLAPPRHAGRPSKYDPAFCDQVIELMKEGLSFGAVAGALGVSRRTIYEWADEHPEFSHTKERGKAPTTAIIFGLKNRAEDDWRDRTEVKHEGGMPVINITPEEAKKL